MAAARAAVTAETPPFPLGALLAAVSVGPEAGRLSAEVSGPRAVALPAALGARPRPLSAATTMSSFSESALEKKLSELSNSQQSVQTLSLWLIHHRKHAGPIVSVWHRELRKGKPAAPFTSPSCPPHTLVCPSPSIHSSSAGLDPSDGPSEFRDRLISVFLEGCSRAQQGGRHLAWSRA